MAYNLASMTVQVRSFAKINLGLSIGARREDRFHELLTVYQTIGLHDVIHVSVGRGAGIQIRCTDPRVPKDESNTCHRIVEKAMQALGAKGRVVIEIEKRLPVQGGLGGASSNAVAAVLGLERALKKTLPAEERLRIAAEVGSDLPLFLVGGTVLGVGRGEQVYPVQDLPSTACLVVTPEVGVSTPRAFAEWDRKLTALNASDRMVELGRGLSAWLSEMYSGAPRQISRRGRAENPLLALVRAGIKNDFEEVVFPEYPELSEGKSALERAGAKYASLSGSGSALYGLFASKEAARVAVTRLRKQGWAARATTTLTRGQYWRRLFDC
ncbi:MAG TPA: 4-(cytidine 5'-diphospho)-2-C-methyl-D-erythritol kinase [Candidatus Dormibacteraeota bacterium]|jgi:4-diphosphocytidyl-2-C-methyl-D-erythritol kinase|nr:4-(cytidine 5'-diphospho)-2-C-methyl-D-erythritol kinase [Candidatus Dormibacteraeota bacterium]